MSQSTFHSYTKEEVAELEDRLVWSSEEHDFDSALLRSKSAVVKERLRHDDLLLSLILDHTDIKSHPSSSTAINELTLHD